MNPWWHYTFPEAIWTAVILLTIIVISGGYDTVWGWVVTPPCLLVGKYVGHKLRKN